MKFPGWNPFRADPIIPVANGNFLQFPLGYKFEKSIHGVKSLATSTNQKVRVMSDMTKCMSVNGENQLIMESCSDQPSQFFSYDPRYRVIRLGTDGLCVEYNPSSHYLFMIRCDGNINQMFFYSMFTQEVRTLANGYCLDLPGSGFLYMNKNCHSGENQKFFLPSQWLPDIASLNRVWSFSDWSKCMTLHPSRKVLMRDCIYQDPYGFTDTYYQEFEYDVHTRQIKIDGLCLDYHYGLNYLYIHSCHDGANQQFYFDTSSNRLRSGWDDKCVNWNGNVLEMTSCDGRSSEKFQIPSPWLEAMSTSSFDEVRLLSNLKLCLTLEIPEVGGTPLALKECKVGNANQKIYYDSESLQIKLWHTDHCVDYHPGNNNVYMHPCHDGTNQKWYHERSTNRLRSLRSYMCLDWGNGKLYMHGCHGGDNQKFLVPSLWSGQRSYTIHSFDNYKKCMAYNSDQSNNVHMTDCLDGGGFGQHFDYNPLTREIKQDGLCLHVIEDVSEWLLSLSKGLQPIVGNILMMPCNGGNNQKWIVDFTRNRIMSELVKEDCCLQIKPDGNIIGASCLDESSPSKWAQKFLFPEAWTKLQQAIPNYIYPYFSRYIPPALWSSNVCHVDWLKNVMKSCDDSMTLLLGSSMSIGTLRAIANIVNEKGPQYMPGSCCLDNPLTSQYFGSNVSAGVIVSSFLHNS